LSWPGCGIFSEGHLRGAWRGPEPAAPICSRQCAHALGARPANAKRPPACGQRLALVVSIRTLAPQIVLNLAGEKRTSYQGTVRVSRGRSIRRRGGEGEMRATKIAGTGRNGDKAGSRRSQASARAGPAKPASGDWEVSFADNFSARRGFTASSPRVEGRRKHGRQRIHPPSGVWCVPF
jgi:hypothetical protein